MCFCGATKLRNQDVASLVKVEPLACSQEKAFEATLAPTSVKVCAWTRLSKNADRTARH